MKMLLFSRQAGELRAAEPARAPSAVPLTPIAALHLFVLAAFAFSQPMYDILGARTDYLFDLDVGAAVLIGIVGLVSLMIPFCLAAALWVAARCAPRAYTGMYAVAVYLLLILMAAQPLTKFFLFPPPMMIGMSLAAAAAAAYAYFRFSPIRSVVTAASPAILIFPAIFLFRPPVSDLL